jgi:hypothetical protein
MYAKDPDFERRETWGTRHAGARDDTRRTITGPDSEGDVGDETRAGRIEKKAPCSPCLRGESYPDTCDANHTLPARAPAILNPVSPPEIARLRRFAKCNVDSAFLDLHC